MGNGEWEVLMESLITTGVFHLLSVNQETSSTAVGCLSLNPMVKSKGIPEAIIRLTVCVSQAEYARPLTFSDCPIWTEKKIKEMICWISAKRAKISGRRKNQNKQKT